MLVAKQKLGRIPSILESPFLIHPNRDFESAPPSASRIYLVSFHFVSAHSPSLNQKPPNAADTPDEDMPREEPHDGSEAQLAEDEEGSASEEGREGKRDERGGDDRLRVFLPDDFGDFACEDVEERLPGRQTTEGHFPRERQRGEGIKDDIPLLLSSCYRFHLRNCYHRT